MAEVVEMTLKQGSRGAAVTSLQQQLTALGFGDLLQPEGVDGVYGTHTAAAVASFQGTAGLVPDGVYGAQTRAALTAALADRAAKSVQAARVPGVKVAAPVVEGKGKYFVWAGLALAALWVLLDKKGSRPAFGDYRDESGLAPENADGEDEDDGDEGIAGVRDYNYFVVDKETNEVYAGNEYKEDALDEAQNIPEAGRVKVVARRNVNPDALKAFEARNPDTDNRPMSGPVQVY